MAHLDSCKAPARGISSSLNGLHEHPHVPITHLLAAVVKCTGNHFLVRACATGWALTSIHVVLCCIVQYSTNAVLMQHLNFWLDAILILTCSSACVGPCGPAAAVAMNLAS